jgi:indolepyruvate ferredoxin oxidoreductase
MVKNTAVSFPSDRRNIKAIERGTRAEDNVYVDAQALAEGLFGDHMPTNLLLLGAAYQHGCLPVSADAIEQAIRLNGAAVEKSLASFRWGRASVSHPDLVHDVLNPETPEPVVDGKALKILEATGATGELRRLLAIRIPELVAYKNAKYAREYADAVMEVAAHDAEVAEAFARGLHKLMSYKDEYEVARLHLDPVERAKVEREFGEGAKVLFMLHPPVLRALGLKRKLKLGPWFAPMFRVLRGMRRLRGTPLDLFGYAEVRRVERRLPGEYRALVERALDELRPETQATVVKIAALPDVVRGYEDIKLRNVERFRAEASELERELREGPKASAKPRRIELPVVNA